MSDPLTEHRVLIGAADWRYPAWTGDFYPEDLPEDWRLGYYGNEFPVVGIPPDYVLDAAGRAALEEDSDGTPGFVVRIAQADGAAQRLAAARALGPRCVGVLVEAADMAPAQLADVLGAGASLPLAVAGVALPADAPAGVRPCWDGRGEPPRGAGLKLACLSATEATPRRLREVMEGLLADAAGTAVLLLDGDPPPVEVLRNAVVIRDLL